MPKKYTIRIQCYKVHPQIGVVPVNPQTMELTKEGNNFIQISKIRLGVDFDDMHPIKIKRYFQNSRLPRRTPQNEPIVYLIMDMSSHKYKVRKIFPMNRPDGSKRLSSVFGRLDENNIYETDLQKYGWSEGGPSPDKHWGRPKKPKRKKKKKR